MNKDFVHAKKEHLYANSRKDIIANQVFHGASTKKEETNSLFFYLFPLNIQEQTYDEL